MENQHRKIKGYRELSQDEIDLMNRIKEQGVALGDLIAELQNLQGTVVGQGDPEQGEARRWISIGKTHLQQGLMALTRAVAKPEFF